MATSEQASGPDIEPAYLRLARSGELVRRAGEARRHLEDCDLCARDCRRNRLNSVKGVACRTGARAMVASAHPHFGEEAPLRGRHGSGTIFFSWCSLRCVYCQNWDISQQGVGREVGPEELAAIMLDLQSQGCHNINFVSPSHVVAQILEALVIAADSGLREPLVYNTGGYDSMAALALLDGVIDIYMPDGKYTSAVAARKYSKVKGYPDVNRRAIREMHRQVGDLILDSDGVARRGLLVRHLMLPGGLAGTAKMLHFLAEEISRDTYLNLMDQYQPSFKAGDYIELNRRPSVSDLKTAYELALDLGLRRLDGRRSLSWPAEARL